MKILLKSACLLLFFTVDLFSQSNCTPIPEVKFPGGRVIMTFDGNVHDDDDILALPYAAGLWWAAGLKDKVVQIEYNNHVCLINNSEVDGSGPGAGDDSQNMRNSASGAISRFNYNQNIFYDYETQGTASTNKMASEIEKSTAANPLWIIAGGPMETVWRGLDSASQGHDHVTVISHSSWNEAHLHCGGDHNWNSLKNTFQSQGVFFVGFCSGGGCSQPSGLNDQNGGFSSGVSNWSWMQGSSKEYNRWIFGRNPFGTNKFDPSDAGMSYFLISGGPFNGGKKTPDHNDARKLMENPCEDNVPPAENILPVLAITAPTTGATVTVGSSVTVNLTASDSDGFINKHQVFVNGTMVDTDGTNYSPYTLSNISSGTHIIKATVMDNSGATTSKTVTITAGSTQTPPAPPPTNNGPSVVFTSLDEGQILAVGSTVTVNLNANDPDGTISKHQIYVNNILVDTDGSNYSAHKINNIAAGTYVIKAVVTDNDGNTASRTVSISAEAATPPNNNPVPSPPASGNDPTVVFNTLVDNQQLSPGSTVSVSITANDPNGSIVKHQIYVNNKLVDTDGSNYTTHKINNVSAGTYLIKAVVTDNDGNTASDSVTINVQQTGTPPNTNPNPLPPTSGTAPTVVFNAPINNQEVSTGATISVSINASDPNGSIVKHQIFVDGKLVDTDGSGFTPHKINSITAGTHVIKAKVTDNSGETATASITIIAKANPNSGPPSNTPPSNGNNAPTVSILAPTKNQNFSVGTTVSIKLSASDSDGSVVKHQIFVNNKLVDTDGSSFTPHKIINVKSGTYLIRAVVTDNDGATASQTTSFIVAGNTQKQAPVTAENTNKEVIDPTENFELKAVEDASFLRIARNPVQQGILKINQKGNRYLRIINLSGITVKELGIEKENLQIDLSGMAPGLYILSSDTAIAKFILN